MKFNFKSSCRLTYLILQVDEISIPLILSVMVLYVLFLVMIMVINLANTTSRPALSNHVRVVYAVSFRSSTTLNVKVDFATSVTLSANAITSTTCVALVTVVIYHKMFHNMGLSCKYESSIFQVVFQDFA